MSETKSIVERIETVEFVFHAMLNDDGNQHPACKELRAIAAELREIAWGLRQKTTISRGHAAKVADRIGGLG
jgi:hypothetical protein